jgi:hypothetical protein
MPKGKSRIVKKAEREAKNATTTRATYLADYRGGMRVTDIAKKYGVSRQAVDQAINGRAKFMERQRARDAIRRAPSVRGPKICSACGGAGHQKNSPKFHPENAAA